jgi:hypothetical protein
MAEPPMTERQRKWFASVRESFERDTGKTLAEWVEIARSCPETRPRDRLRWFKDNHGLMQNRASYVLKEAFPSDQPGWDQPDQLSQALWAEPASRAVFEAVQTAALKLPDVVTTQRKSFSAFSRKVQFAAMRPVKGGTVMLGVAIPPDADPRLTPSKNESWSERLKSRMPLASPAEVDQGVEALLRRAWDAS